MKTSAIRKPKVRQKAVNTVLSTNPQTYTQTYTHICLNFLQTLLLPKFKA